MYLNLGKNPKRVILVTPSMAKRDVIKVNPNVVTIIASYSCNAVVYRQRQYQNVSIVMTKRKALIQNFQNKVEDKVERTESHPVNVSG